MIELSEITLILPILLYAETHYRFRYFFSYLRKQEPEILADAPHRIEPGNDIPLLVFAKDADQYPCLIRQITVTVSQNGVPKASRRLLTTPLKLKNKWWWTVYRIKAAKLKGWIEVNVQFDIETRNLRRTYHNDNYRTSTKRPLRVFLAETPLPKLPGLCLGDAHVHSSYTEDQVEYGAPPSASVILSKAMGLAFFCITDHSYDLDDSLTDYLQNDPSLPKWKSLQREVTLLNRRHEDHAILLGEEVSCRNHQGQNVHLLLFGNRHFVPGSGDSAERWFRTRSQFSVVEVLERLSGGIAVAAHPKEQTPVLQQLLLGRGSWSQPDLRMNALAGIQFLNGDYFDGFIRGKSAWTKALLSGSRVHAIAGNDAHGNFNRFRQVGFPFVRISEHSRQIFGKMRTGLFLKSPISEAAIRTAIKNGHTLISDGPVASIRATNDSGAVAFHGETISGRTLKVYIEAKSSKEFGTLRNIKLHLGFLGRRQEQLVFSARATGLITFEQALSIGIVQAAYLRLTVETSSDGTFDNLPHACLTNPIWCDPEES